MTKRKIFIVLLIVLVAAGVTFFVRSPLGWFFLTAGRSIIPAPSLPFLPQEPEPPGPFNPENIWPENVLTPGRPDNSKVLDESPDPGHEKETEIQIAGNTADPMMKIEQKYRPQFLGLQAEYESKLNRLLGSALAEYKQVKSSRSNTSLRQLAKKYISAGQALEAESDGQFYALLANMENELGAAGLPTTLTDQLRANYIRLKNERRKQILSMAKSKI